MQFLELFNKNLTMKNLMVIRHSGEQDRLKYCLDKIKKSNVDFVVIEDCYEKSVPVKNHEYNHLYITKEYIFENRLTYIKGRTGWVFGDYVLYFAREKFKNYDYYWIVDDDLYLNLNIDNFILEYSSFDHDLIARNFGVSKEDWYWRKTLEDRYPSKVYAMLFGIARFSAKALDFLRSNRAELKSSYVLNGNVIEPNDECFSATLLANNGFKCENLFIKDDRFHPFFSLEDPIFYEELENIAFNNKIIHPVCSRQRGIDKLISFSKQSSARYEENLFRILNISGKDFLLSIDPDSINKISNKVSGVLYFELPEIYKTFDNPFLVKKWFYEKTTLVLDFNYNDYIFAFDLKWNGDVDFIARNNKSKKFLNDFLKKKEILLLGKAVKKLKIIEKYKYSDSLLERVKVILDFIYASIDFFHEASEMALLHKES